MLNSYSFFFMTLIMVDHLPSQTTILTNKYFDGDKLHGNAHPQLSSDSTTLSSTSANAANTEVTENTGAAIIPEVTPGRITTSTEPAASIASSTEDPSTTTSISNSADETQLVERMAKEQSSTAVIVKEESVEKSPETSEAVQIDNQAMENSKETSTIVQADEKVSEAAETIQAETKIGAKTSEAAEDIQADIITRNNTPEIAASMKTAAETSNSSHEVANAAQANSKPESPANKDDNVLSSVTDRKNQQIMVGPSAAGFEEKVAHLENMRRGVYAVAAEDAKEDAPPAFEDAHPKGSQEPLIEVINLP
jgi:hypothetical protein